MKKREEIETEYTWNMADMLPSDEAWESMFEDIKEKLSQYGLFQGHLAESADQLYRCLLFDEEVSKQLELLFVYGRQKSDENTGNQKYQSFAGRAQGLSYKAAELSSYIVPEILSMEEKTLTGYRSSYKELAYFKRSLDLILYKKQHTLSVEMENLLAQSYEATQGSSQIFNMFNNADMKFPTILDGEGKEIAITHGNFIALMESGDRALRERAFHGLYNTYKQFQNTLAATFAANVKQAGFYASAKHYASSRQFYLSDNEIPEEVYDNLITAVHQSLPSLHKYVQLRKEALGLDEIHMYDLYTPIVAQVETKIPYDTAKEMVREGLAPLGQNYLSALEEGFNHRWIDVYENEGKRSGAYSWGAYGTHPYVLLNYNGTLDHVFTLAHEMGHALHSYHSDKNQSYADAGYKIFVAEVASTCNEALLIRHMLNKTTDKKERCYLVNHFLESFRGTLYRQTMFAEFEAIVHKKSEAGVSLTSEVLCKIYRKLNEEYFGPGMIVDQDIDFEWSRIPHFYTPFYVYQYATGFSAAIAISSGILTGDKQILDGYFQFLSGGNSMPPIELLKLCGVDMSTKKPVEEALLLFSKLLEEFEILIRDTTEQGR